MSSTLSPEPYSSSCWPIEGKKKMLVPIESQATSFAKNNSQAARRRPPFNPAKKKRRNKSKKTSGEV
jgi:hypothetical protein